MDIKIAIIERATKWLVGGSLFDFIKAQVETAASMDISGEEKRVKVLEDTKRFFGSVLTVFVNIAIEVAVLALKSKVGDLDGK